MKMNQQDYIEKLHGEILTIMDIIHNICEANSLRYYLASGSLLGSIRHKGFIPWDDDLDILMPRKDFDIFMNIAPGLLAPNFELFWYSTKPKYWKLFAKVSKKNTLFVESPEMPLDTQWGVFVDIFPLDETPAYSAKHRRIQKQVHQLGSLLEIKVKSPNTFAQYIKKVVSLFVSRRYIQNRIYKLSTSLSAKGNDYCCTFASLYDIKQEISPAEWYGAPQLAPFRDRFYFISTEAEKILENQFGYNYMELPPVEKRRTHYPVKVLFSDGEVLEFERPKVRLTVKTQGYE